MEEGEGGEAPPLGVTSTSFFSFKSTFLLLVPAEEEEDEVTHVTMTMFTGRSAVRAAEASGRKSQTMKRTKHSMRTAEDEVMIGNQQLLSLSSCLLLFKEQIKVSSFRDIRNVKLIIDVVMKRRRRKMLKSEEEPSG